MRTLEQALARADSLRDFRKVNESAFEKNEDFQDIVNLADALEELKEDLALPDEPNDDESTKTR